ncbi:2-dehydropantoate 2-reductase [Isoptericola sp. b441]|uniref:2-dehydropantoate 2-reductase n=1 Tax=Actinotalea lenta TaxID=3064654 RepID=A0ABT9D8M2_9CELL|nr:2-dehydropantoate 2-reductase [Isoptericola sp. b441]MDO8107235.1 2-dehydropantoate 2-reductase [Isoptericola sp. b441]
MNGTSGARALRVGVMGAGSIGCYVGGRLAAAGQADVTLVGRDRVVEELGRHGLTISDRTDRRTVPARDLTLSTDVASLADADVVLVCVKSGQTADVGAALDPVLRPDAVVLSLQNGVHNVDRLHAALGTRQVLGAVVDFNVVSRPAGAVHCGLPGPLTVARSGTTTGAAVVAALAAAGLEVTTTADIAAVQWAKLLVNLNNAISALSDVPTVELMTREGYRRVVAGLLAEGVAVLRAAGIRPGRVRRVPARLMLRVLRLPDPLARRLLAARLPTDAQARSSMWEDLVRGRPTEVDDLNGEIVRLAERTGTPAPLNRRIVDLVHAAEAAGPGSPGMAPGALWSALH